MFVNKKCLLTALLIACAVFNYTGTADAGTKKTAVPQPSYPPLKNEYYPVQNTKYPQAIANPNAHTRDIVFKGKPVDIFTKINMVSQIVFPSAPVMVNIGKPEAYTVEVIPEYNSVFVKPVREVEMTNIIVTTESGGVYLMIVKENPFVPWDIRVKVADPLKTAKMAKDDTPGIITMLHTGRRIPEYQYTPMDMRTPGSSAYVYDPVSKMACSIYLKRAIAMPREKRTAYWLEFRNALPVDTQQKTRLAAYSISERSIWTRGLFKAAMIGVRNGESIPTLMKGDKVDIMLFITGSSIPASLKFRFALAGTRNIPIDVVLPTAVAKKNIKTAASAESTVDEKLQMYYDDLVRKGKIKPADPVTNNTNTSVSSDGSNLSDLNKMPANQGYQPTPQSSTGQTSGGNIGGNVNNAGQTGVAKPADQQEILTFPAP